MDRSTRAPRPSFDPLGAYEGYHPQRAALMLGALVAAAALFGASMPLPWHHRLLTTGGYVVVHGIDGDSWLLAVAVVAIGFALRFVPKPPTFYTKWAVTFVSLASVLGMFIDYIDWQTRAAQPQFQASAYFGPGFFVALGGTALFVAANALAWLAE